jgi:hypothetical protein
MRINIATVHWKSSFFQDVQHRHIASNLGDFRMWAFTDRIREKRPQDDNMYHFHKDSGETNHLVKLDMLADFIVADAPNEDVILFMDGDAWPIRPAQGFIEESLASCPVGAVVRLENGERYPHPSFLFTTVGYWKEAGLSWKGGEIDGKKYDINFISAVLRKRKQEWIRLKRTGGLADHPVFFSVYGDMVYHHGAGFRVPVSTYCAKNGIRIGKEDSLKMLDVFLERYSAGQSQA